MEDREEAELAKEFWMMVIMTRPAPRKVGKGIPLMVLMESFREVTKTVMKRRAVTMGPTMVWA